MDMTAEIIRALGEAFPGMEIYGEQVGQGFTPPCMAVYELEGAAQPYPGYRVLWSLPFEVRFFPAGESPRARCREMAPRLAACLGRVAGVGAAQVHWQIAEDVLHFFATYRYFAHCAPETVKMEELETNVG